MRLKQNFSLFNSQKERTMKQAVNKAEPIKASTDVAVTKTKVQQTNKTETSRLLKLKETNLFNRFLEANCDCV